MLVSLFSYLQKAFSDGHGLRRQDSGRVFSAVADNDIGRDIAWSFLKENFFEMAEFAGSFTSLGNYVEQATYEFNTIQQLQDLIQFKEDNFESLGSAQRAVAQAIERVGANIAWMEANYEQIVTIISPIDNLDIRLPTDLVPVHYTLRLQPILEYPFPIHGSVVIEMKVQKVTSFVILHMTDIVTFNSTIKVRKRQKHTSY